MHLQGCIVSQHFYKEFATKACSAERGGKRVVRYRTRDTIGKLPMVLYESNAKHQHHTFGLELFATERRHTPSPPKTKHMDIGRLLPIRLSLLHGGTCAGLLACTTHRAIPSRVAGSLGDAVRPAASQPCRRVLVMSQKGDADSAAPVAGTAACGGAAAPAADPPQARIVVACQAALEPVDRRPRVGWPFAADAAVQEREHSGPRPTPLAHHRHQQLAAPAPALQVEDAPHYSYGEAGLGQKLGQNFNSAGISLFLKMWWVSVRDACRKPSHYSR